MLDYITMYMKTQLIIADPSMIQQEPQQQESQHLTSKTKDYFLKVEFNIDFLSFNTYFPMI